VLTYSAYLQNRRHEFLEYRSLTRAAQKPFPSRDRQGAVYANFRKLVLAERGPRIQLEVALNASVPLVILQGAPIHPIFIGH
jgi:hypothetical protein